jgi:hypothetical protein
MAHAAIAIGDPDTADHVSVTQHRRRAGLSDNAIRQE